MRFKELNDTELMKKYSDEFRLTPLNYMYILGFFISFIIMYDTDKRLFTSMLFFILLWMCFIGRMRYNIHSELEKEIKRRNDED